MVKPAIPTREVIDFFFEETSEGLWFCKNPYCHETKKQTRNTGYTNLKNHLSSCIGRDFANKYGDWKQSTQDTNAQLGSVDEFVLANNITPRERTRTSTKSLSSINNEIQTNEETLNIDETKLSNPKKRGRKLKESNQDLDAMQLFNANPNGDMAQKFFDLKQQQYIIDAELSLAEKRQKLEQVQADAKLEMATKRVQGELDRLQAELEIAKQKTKAEIAKLDAELNLARKRAGINGTTV